MALPILVVDAFSTGAPFTGNQAGVCLLAKDSTPDAAWMQRVAAEMGYSETAFVQPTPGGAFGLRWFTPAKEVPLCGHATLAAAHVLWERGALPKDKPAVFDTLSGRLTCTRGAQGITMDFPTDAPVAAAAPAGLLAALGVTGKDLPAFEGKTLGNVMVVLPDEASVRALAPDMKALLAVSATSAYIVTAPADKGGGYVCRYFAPAWGIDEDPATGSIQCTLGPYWAKRLGKAELECRQLSRRGARMLVRPAGDRTAITGTAITTVSGDLLAGPVLVNPAVS